MKKLTIAILMTLTFNSYAQMKSPQLTCEPLKEDVSGFPFSAKFDDKIAIVTFKGWTYSVPYNKVYVDPLGVRWTFYENTELRVSTNYPFENFVAIFTPSFTPPITRSLCK